MDFLSLLYFLLIGAAAGWISGQIMKGKDFGWVQNMIVGVVGSLLGGWLFSFLGISAAPGLVGSLVTAVFGAIVLLWIARMVNK